MGRRSLINAIDARLPAQAVVGLSKSPEIVGVTVNGKPRSSGSSGIARRRALGIPEAGFLSIDGGQGSHRSNGSEVKFGVIEVDNSINSGHFGFLDWKNGPNRIVDTDRCTYWFPRRRCINSATTTNSTHGTTVSSILAGSIEQGQDFSVASTSGRRLRSGIATEATIHYYSVDTNADVAVAIEEATWENGVDIINMSLSPGGDTHCDNGDWSGARGAVRAAENAGILIVTAAGNDDNKVNKSCTVNSYGAYPDTLTVGALNETSDLASLNSVGLASYSGRGSIQTTLNGGRTAYTRMVDLVVTGAVDHTFGSGSIGYHTATKFGTSFAAPQVAGTAGLLLDWAHDRGGLGTTSLEEDPYVLRVLLAVMGDGAYGVSGGGSARYSVSTTRGFGNLRFVNLDTELGSGGAWGFQKRFVTQGDVVEWSVGSSGPESSSVNGWKFAALWDEDLYSGSADIKFELIDKCPSGGGISVIRTADRHALKARMRVRESEIGTKFAGRCLWVRATVEHAAGTVPLYNG